MTNPTHDRDVQPTAEELTSAREFYLATEACKIIENACLAAFSNHASMTPEAYALAMLNERMRQFRQRANAWRTLVTAPPEENEVVTAKLTAVSKWEKNAVCRALVADFLNDGVEFSQIGYDAHMARVLLNGPAKTAAEWLCERIQHLDVASDNKCDIPTWSRKHIENMKWDPEGDFVRRWRAKTAQTSGDTSEVYGGDL